MKPCQTLLPLLFAGSLLAQAQPFVLPKGELTPQQLIDATATYLDWNILFETPETSATPAAEPTTRRRTSRGSRPRRTSRPRTLQPIKLQTQITTDREGCESLLHNLLNCWRLVVTPVSGQRNTYQVVDALGPRARDIGNEAVYKTPAQILAHPDLKWPVITTVPLKHIHARRANNALRPFLAGIGGTTSASTVQVAHAGDARSLIVQGLQDQVAQTILLIRKADVEDPLSERCERLMLRIQELERRIGALQNKNSK